MALSTDIHVPEIDPVPPAPSQQSQDSALRASQSQLARELSDARTLQRISSELLIEHHVEPLYDRLLEAAMELMRSDFASVQMFVPGKNELRLLASRNFHPLSREFWQKVEAGGGSTCGQALMEHRRVVAPDLERFAPLTGTRDLDEYRRSNIRACQSTPLISRSGHPLGMISTHWREPHEPPERDFALFDALVRQAADLIERTQAEEALRESEERFRLFVDNVREYALVQTDLGYCITGWNPGAERMFGYSSHEVHGKDFGILLAPEDLEANILGKELDRISESGRNEDARWFVRKDGSHLWTRWVTEPVRDEHGAVLGLAKVLRDETERQRLENTARQSEKLAVVGRMASSIAHEINNPLEAVTNLLYLARQFAVSPETIQYLDQAELELQRVTHIATETLKFHRQSSQPALVDVVEIVESVLALHEGRIREARIAVERSFRPHPLITCLTSEIRQVLANLIGNAIDAMAKSSERRLLVRIHGAVHPRTGEPGLKILVADTGAGINPAAKARLFEPFFTTKESTGTGLGLWVSAEIVNRHCGVLRFRSSRKGTRHGTVFSLFLTQGLHAIPAETIRTS